MSGCSADCLWFIYSMPYFGQLCCLVYWYSVYLHTHTLFHLSTFASQDRDKEIVRQALYPLFKWTTSCLCCDRHHNRCYPYTSSQVIRQWHILPALYTHIHRLARRAWLMTQPQTPADATAAVRWCHSTRGVPTVSLQCHGTRIKAILFHWLGKDQSSRTLIVTICNSPLAPHQHSFRF